MERRLLFSSTCRPMPHPLYGLPNNHTGRRIPQASKMRILEICRHAIRLEIRTLQRSVCWSFVGFAHFPMPLWPRASATAQLQAPRRNVGRQQEASRSPHRPQYCIYLALHDIQTTPRIMVVSAINRTPSHAAITPNKAQSRAGYPSIQRHHT